MKTWMFAVLGLVLWSAAGCRADQAARDAWAREDRRREDEIYRLRYKVDELEDELAAAKKSGDSRKDDDWSGRGRKKASDSTPVDSPETELPPSSQQKVPDALRPGRPAKAIGLNGASMENALSSQGDAITEAGLAQIPQFRPSGDSRRATMIVLDHTLTGGIGSSNGSGDVGVLAVIEPRDAAGRVIDAPAAVDVTVMDAAVKSGDAHVGFWKFTAAETAAQFRRAGSTGAMYLGMAWPSEPPKHRNLQLFVRYVTADGRKLEANQPIEIALPGDKTARWTPTERVIQDVREERVIRDQRMEDRTPPTEPRRLSEWASSRDADERPPRTASRRRAGRLRAAGLVAGTKVKKIIQAGRTRMAMRKAIAAGIIAAALGGCGTTAELTNQPGYSPTQTAEQPPAGAYANPFFVPIADPHLAWETITEVISDYFRIEQEEPVRAAGNMLLEGSIRTAPEVSPTLFEPWRNDTVDYDQRVENTLQTMRRRAMLRVMPAQGGYWVEVTVLKELEDAKPEHAMAGVATFRYDSTLTGIVNPITSAETAEGWIARGRDTALEQRIIAHLSNRCGR